MEDLILVDTEDNEVGVAPRQDCHRFPGKLHRAIMVVLKNKDGKILLAKRAKDKLWGGVWDGTIATHVYHGETPEDSSYRALKKELNLENLKLQNQGKFLYQARWGKEGIEHEVCHLFLGKLNTQKVAANPKEITGLKWVSRSELREKIQKEKESLSPWFLMALQQDFGGEPSRTVQG